MKKLMLVVFAGFYAPICAADPDLATMKIIGDSDIVWTEIPRAPKRSGRERHADAGLRHRSSPTA
jgi:hypothetical protein